MIDAFKKRLTLTALCTLALIFTGAVAAINIANHLTVQRQIAQSLDILTGSDSSSGDQSGSGLPVREMGRENLPEIRATTLSRVAGYCVVRLTRAGEIHEWKTESPGLYDEALVRELVEAVKAGGKREGRAGAQAYRMESRSYGALIVLMDIRAELANAQTLLRITAVVGIAACLLLSLCAVLLIRRMLMPVQQAFDKQRHFVWDASHELKTPLAVISANAQVLEKELGGNESLGYILAEVNRMDGLVQSLLTLARMDADKPEAGFESFDVGMELLSAALPMESLAFEQGKRLETRISPGIFCVGSKALVGQLAVILLSNALKFAGDGGVVTLSLEARGRQRFIRVHNTGSYIAPEERERIFDRFYQSEDSRSRAGSGSGLGLSIAKSIVRLHHGEIDVKSNPEAGTVFTAVLYDCGG